MSGGAGNDHLSGGPETDDAVNTLDGGDGDDAIEAGGFGDIVLGGAGNDIINGGVGSDTIDAGPGDDIVLAGAGNDSITGGDGSDKMEGSTGDDVFFFDDVAGGGSELDTVTDVGNGGIDRLDFSQLTVAVTVNLLNGRASHEKRKITIEGPANFEDVTGGAGDDQIHDNAQNNRLAGGPGDDHYFFYAAAGLTLGAHTDVVIELPGEGKDEINFADVPATDPLTADISAEQTLLAGIVIAEHATRRLTTGENVLRANIEDITGGQASDQILGNDSANRLVGNRGNDVIEGRSNDDEIEGNDGDDIIHGESGNDTIYGGAGEDTINGDGGDDTISGGDGVDFIQGDAGNDTIYGDGGDDDLQGNDGADTIYGGAGNDFIFGSAGNDTLQGDTGADVIFGEDGNDTIRGNVGIDLLFGQTGDDNIDGGPNQDFILGDLGNDTIHGGSGDDFVSGGADTGLLPQFGDDLYGGTDHDMVVGGLPVGYTALDGFVGSLFFKLFRSEEFGGLAPRPLPTDQDANFDALDFIAFLTTGTVTYTLPSGEVLNLTFNSGGTDADDRLHGDAGNDLLVGEEGTDHLFGDWGNDVMFAWQITTDQTDPATIPADQDDRLEGGPDDDSPMCGTNGVNLMIGGTSDVNLNYTLDHTPFASPLSGGFVFNTCFDAPPELLPTLPVSISGQKFRDINGDGIRDEGEQGLDGWTIVLRDAEGIVLATTVTKSIDLNEDGAIDPSTESGLYSFVDEREGGLLQGLEAGVYYVYELLADGFQMTLPQVGDEVLVNVDTNNKAVGTTQMFDGESYVVYSLALNSGIFPEDVERATNLNFANVELSDISGIKWNDLNGDGVFDQGEPPLSGWSIYLDLNQNNNPDVDEPLQVTDVNGEYHFTGVPAGDYKVHEYFGGTAFNTYPGGAVHDVSVGFAETIANVNFGNILPASISGRKFRDDNANGIFDVVDGEVGLSSAAKPGGDDWGFVYLDMNLNRVYDAGDLAANTLPDGTYFFNFLSPGLYVLAEQTKAGEDWLQSFPDPDADLGVHMFVLQSGQSITGADFGNYQLGTITGRKIDDADGDGILTAAENGLADWQVYLDLNRNGLLDPGEPTDVTDATGRYAFEDLVPGVYTVAEVPQDGWVPTFPAVDSDTGRREHTVTLKSGNTVDFIHFGNVHEVTIEGTKWHDLNANGLQDLDEPGLPNWTIFIDDNNNGLLDRDEHGQPTERTAVTSFDDPATEGIDESGRYRFTGLLPGTYVVQEVLKDVWTQTARIQNGDGTMVDFGNVLTASITGSKWLDVTADGRQRLIDADPTEPKGDVFLPGWQVYLDLNNNGIWDVGEPQTTTLADDPTTADVDETGHYEFTGLLPGTYVVREVPQAGYVQSLPGGQELFSVALSAGDQVVTRDFANSKEVTISGTKWRDDNANGVRDDGEPVLPGFLIYLDLNKNGELDANEPTALTDALGQYRFSGLPPAAYLVAEQATPSWQQTFPRKGGSIERHYLRLPLEQQDAEPLQDATQIDFGNRRVADCNSDNKIDMADLLDFNAAFHSSTDALNPGTGVYNVCFDFEPDGDIDFVDLYHFRELYGLSLPPAVPAPSLPGDPVDIAATVVNSTDSSNTPVTSTDTESTPAAAAVIVRRARRRHLRSM